jgi:thioredoxin 2
MAPSIIACPNCGKRNRVNAVPEGVPRCAACHTLLPWLVEADVASFDEETRSSVPVLIDFWAPWCGPCKWVEPEIEQLARERTGNLKVVRVDIDAAADPATRYGVQSIPLLLLLRDGEEIDRIVGALPKRQLDDWLDRHLGVGAGAAPPS